MNLIMIKKEILKPMKRAAFGRIQDDEKGFTKPYRERL
jgi:hypothetical protein